MATAMGRRMAQAAATAVAGGLLVTGLAACEPAPVPPRPPTPRPPVTTTTTTAPAPAPTELAVTYRDGGGGTVAYTVRCGPGAASSITPQVAGLDPGRACATAAAQRTLLVEGPPPGRYCTAQWFGPETATVTGHVDDAPVDQRLGRGNGCRESDWRRLGDLVLRPTARR